MNDEAAVQIDLTQENEAVQIAQAARCFSYMAGGLQALNVALGPDKVKKRGFPSPDKTQTPTQTNPRQPDNPDLHYPDRQDTPPRGCLSCLG